MERQLGSRPYWEEFLINFILSPNTQDKLIKEAIDHFNLTLKEFAKEANIPEGTLYKISSVKAFDIRVSTLENIVTTLKKLEIRPHETPAVGIITARYALQEIEPIISIGDRSFMVAEYPAATIEEEIIQGIRAENDGCVALICGPIAANTLNRVVRIPVIGLHFSRDQLQKALVEAIAKISE
ncbi:MAG: transcriptional regulator [Candidatus Heimdallarchaeota archaeon]|nr:MAG: transcriptional regulator [Candidatus Heimdallarchaeota archaeon]